jgi:hypothetical protein
LKHYYSIYDAVRVSGLTRGQIDQSISRYGFPVHAGTVTPGQERRFCCHDIFWLSVVKRLTGYGVRWSAIPLLLEDVGAVELTEFGGSRDPNRVLWRDEEEGARYLTLWYGVRADADTGMRITIKNEEPRLQAVVFFPSEIETWQRRGMNATVIDLVNLQAEVDKALMSAVAPRVQRAQAKVSRRTIITGKLKR